MSEVRVREAARADLDDIASLWIEMTDYHAGLDSYYRRTENAHKEFADFAGRNIESTEAAVFVAEAGGQVVGFTMGLLSKRPPIAAELEYGFLTDLAVTELYRRRGVGRKLFNALKAWFDSKDIDRIETSVYANNALSNAFWAAMGFKPFLRRDVYKPDQ